MDEEIIDLVDKKIPPACISVEKRLVVVPNPDAEGFICPFLNPSDNKCKIYDLRPFECQLYPFLLNMRHGKVILTVDLNCPYIEKHMQSPEFRAYCEYLEAHLNSPEVLELLKDNPHILQAYEEVREIVELKFPDASK